MLATQLQQMKDSGTFKNERIIISQQSNVISTNLHKNVLNFCANNYLGLANNQKLVSEAKRILDERGFGLNSVRFICGTTDYHKSLESKISNFYEQEDTILFPSCFDANEAIFEAFLTDQDAIISDKLNHASIINGIRLSKAKRFLYENNDMKDLEEKLKSAQDQKLKVIVTDGVFSMDGEIAQLSEICNLAEKYGAVVMVDECHGTGVIGQKGRGSVEFRNCLDKVEIISSTLGKALGGANGGFITGKKEIVEILRQKGRPYLFSNSLPTHIVAAYIKALEILEEEPQHLEKLQSNIQYFRKQMNKLGFELLGNPSSAIIPVLLRDEKLTHQFAEKLLEEKIYVIGFSYPVVAKNLARIRIQVSACHTQQNIDDCIKAFEKIGKQLKVIK